MMENIKVVLFLVCLMVGLPVLILLVRDRVTRPSRKEIDDASRRFLERLNNPDLAALERHFGVPMPQSLVELYGNRAELMRGDFQVAPSSETPADERHRVAYYQPADAQSAGDSWSGLEKYFAFADDGCGNAYLIDPTETDPCVYFHDHETGEMTKVCQHLSEFLRWPKFNAD